MKEKKTTAIEQKRNDTERIEIVIIDDKDHLKLLKAVQAAVKNIKKDSTFPKIPLTVQSFAEARKALDYLQLNRWRYVKAIFLDYELREVHNTAMVQSPSGVEFINEIKKKNPFIDIFGLSAHDPELPVNREKVEFREFREAVRKLIGKEELLDKNKAWNVIESNVVKRIKSKMETPFFSSLHNYVKSFPGSWHVPGHNRGRALYHSKYARPFYDFFGVNQFAADHDIPKSFGSIFQMGNKPDSELGKLENLLTKETFGTEHTAFVTNGNSASNNIVLMSILKPGDEVLIARSNHKSMHYAVVLTGARPTYINSVFSAKYEIMAPPSIADIERHLKEKEKGFYKLLVITGCTYEGLVMDIDRVNRLCKEHGTELFVDEAWYGYSNFHPLFMPTSANKLKVPYVTQSAHKMLSAFRQSAFIHINSEKIDKHFFKDIYNTFTTTSPQYQLIASMDVAAMQMRTEGFELIDKALERAEMFSADFEAFGLKKIKLVTCEDMSREFKAQGFDFDEENIFYDPLKMSFDISELGIDVMTAFHFIKETAGVDLIKYTKNCIQILFTIGTAFDRNKPAELASTFKKLEMGSGKRAANEMGHAFQLEPFYYSNRTPRDFFYGKRELVKLEDAIGKYSATMVTPYPPGISLLLPGEPVTESHVNYLKSILELNHISVHGLINGKIYIDND